MSLGFPHNLKSNTEEPKQMPDMKFMNYLPMHKEMQRPALLPSNRVKEVEGHIQLITDRIVNEFLSEENKPINILPKKTNADLKRFLHKRFEKLNRRTEIAIVELLREKMMGLRVEEPIRKVEPTPSRPARDLSKGAAPSYNRYERDEDNDYEEDRDDTLGANLLEGMRVQDKMMQSSDDEGEDDEY